MKREDLFETLNDVKDEYVSEARETAPAKKRTHWVRWGAIAACAAVAALAGTRLGGPAAPAAAKRPAAEDLPLLPVADFAGAMGFEGLLAYSVDELADSRPWKGETLETLPVYKNKYPSDGAGAAEVEQSVRVDFEPALALPEGLSFDESDADALRKVGEYLKEEYAELLGMENPVAALQDGDYTFSGDGPRYSLHFYDGAGDLTQRMVAYDLAGQWWLIGGEGVWGVWKDEYDLSEKAGDYPIITPEEAADLLCAGNYITTVPAEMPGREYIARTELMYRTERTAEYFMPYYRFLVEVDDPAVTSKDAAALGLKTYGAYYVPAVEGEYLTEMPVWDGSFN